MGKRGETEKQASSSTDAAVKSVRAKKSSVIGAEHDGPMTTLQRVKKMREERARLGLRRLEVYVHPEDSEQVKALAARLQKKREREHNTKVQKASM